METPMEMDVCFAVCRKFPFNKFWGYTFASLGPAVELLLPHVVSHRQDGQVEIDVSCVDLQESCAPCDLEVERVTYGFA